MNQTQPWGRYSELRPAQIEQIRNQVPICYMPCGGLMWRGPHLPLGLGSILAEYFAERAARRTGGVVLPVSPWPSAGVPHPQSLGLSKNTARALLDELLGQLANADWRVIVLVGGHYSQAYDLIAMAAAENAIHHYGLLVLAIPPLAMVDEEMLDHGALWETSALLAVRPDLVQLDQLGTDPLNPATSGVVGRDPRLTASSSLGTSALSMAIERISTATSELLDKDDPAPLHALYQRRREHYRAFIQRYGPDPFHAVLAWWEAQALP